MKNTGYIYRIYNCVNGKSYIGQTIDLEKRIKDHFNGYGSELIYHAIQKHGAEALKWEILESDVEEEVLDKMEKLYIRFFDSMKPNGYNLVPGGIGARGYKWTQEQRQKTSERLKGEKNHQYGKPGTFTGRKHTNKTRAKIGDSHRGKVVSAETRQKLRLANLGKRQSPDTMEKKRQASTGRKHTPDTLAKMSKARKGKRHSPETLEKMSKARKGKPISSEHRAKIIEAMKSPEIRDKLSKTHKGKVLSPEHRAKIGTSLKGRNLSPEELEKRHGEHNPFYGKKHSPETKEKISKANRGKTPWNKGKRRKKKSSPP